ncbi:MAG: DUF3772 domain-containing protein [Pseudomonadota bacterium]
MRLGLFIGALLALIVALPAHAQTTGDPGEMGPTTPLWQQIVGEADALLSDEEASEEALDQMRARLAEQRSVAANAEERAALAVAETRAELEVLGPVEDGFTEAEEVAARRAELTERLQTQQATLVTVQAIRSETSAALARIEARVIDDFSARLVTLGPSPLRPSLWPPAAVATLTYLGDLRAEVERRLASRFLRERMLRALPFATFLALIGLVLVFGVRNKLVGWVSAFIDRHKAIRAQAVAGILLNIARLLVPTIAAILIITALDQVALFGARGQVIIGALPGAAATLILAFWIGQAAFSPAIARDRVLPVADDMAVRAARTTLALGWLVAVHFILQAILDAQSSLPEVRAVLTFPVIVLASLGLLELARVARPHQPPPTEDDAPDAFDLGLLRALRRISFVVALVAPVLAAAGYAALTEYALINWIVTLGLVGAGIVLFHIFLALLEAVFGVDRRESESGSFGLLPVLAGFVILCAGLPIAALIWGARESDLFAAWVFLRDGFAVGDSRISAGDALRLILIFALLVSVTRFLQAVLRRAVLPRTGLDIGGQNALVTGVGYLGITSAALAAITATGLDLSNIALVAGALSVGIGFGLQSIVSNFVAGIILLVERPIKQGDWIEVSGYSGYVRKISVRSTRIETFDRSNVIVPNQDLIAGTVLNYTHGSMVGRLIVKVSVAFGTDTKAVERVLLEIAQSHPMVLRNPEPAVLFMGIAADRYEFEIRAILRDVNWVLNVRSDLNHAITRRFSEEGIVVPHVQTDVHVRSVASAPLQEAAE